ncbi:cytochrome c1 [Saccharospirillum sp. MSK14-1]|uniref:cytochrome c1 n=1 Tax=Saccharospirillum sp. MSK14-1 TaxID=1897632 RepID=UPI0026DA0566
MMKKILLSLFVGLLPMMALSAGGEDLFLDHIKTDVTNKPSLQRGAQLYMNYCMGCHSLEHARYNRMATDLDIPEDILMENLVFTDASFGSLMENSMSEDDGKAWFGSAPPDLTLVARVRGPDWLYTYLRGFYKDESRPMGVNNVRFNNVGMPHVLMELQGLCAEAPHPVSDKRFDPLTGQTITEGGCEHYEVEGSMNQSEYDEAVYDLVNFLEYTGEPFKKDRERIGWMVFAFLAVFLVIAQLLYRELWKDIH